jgi:macrolide transport system ATP-binding/permease protein
MDTEKQLAREFGVDTAPQSYMSGGEKTRLKIAQGFSKNSSVLFADEPTCNLDMSGIGLLEEKLRGFRGGILIVSHDRTLMDNICNKILEVEDTKIKIYNGNYSDYRLQKEMELDRQYFEYDQYIKEKRKIEKAIIEKKEKVRTMRDTPARMGNSEARLHRMGPQRQKAKLDRAAKNMESRIAHLEKKEKPKEISKTKIDIQENEGLYSSIIIECKGLEKDFGNRRLFEKVSFQIERGSKTAIIGDNGTGKTTLLKMILSRDSGVWISESAKIGYFSQSMDILDEDKTILENVLEESIYDETFARIVLARLLFKNEDVHKRVGVLSGGEKVKTEFAKIFLKDINLIVLDEPTNYLDVYSQEALENVLEDYEGTLLFVSHDRQFISDVADHVIVFDEGKVVSFNGNYQEYLIKKETSNMDSRDDIKLRLMQLENRLAEVMGRLSMPGKNDNVQKLDTEFKTLVEEIKSNKILLEK